MCRKVPRPRLSLAFIFSLHRAKTAERHGANRIFGIAALLCDNLWPHAERETVHADAEEARREKMPELMKEDDKPKE